MSYVYIKDDKFNPDNIIIKEFNDNLILNYNLGNFIAILKNVIFKITDNPCIIEDNSVKTKYIKVILRDNLLKNLILIDKKILEYSNKYNITYISFIKEYYYKKDNKDNKDNNLYKKYITLYLQDEVILNKDNLINTYIMLKFKMINGKYQSRIHTYKMNII